MTITDKWQTSIQCELFAEPNKSTKDQTHIYIYTHTHIHTHIYIYIYIHMHNETQPNLQEFARSNSRQNSVPNGYPNTFDPLTFSYQYNIVQLIVISLYSNIAGGWRFQSVILADHYISSLLRSVHHWNENGHVWYHRGFCSKAHLRQDQVSIAPMI